LFNYNLGFDKFNDLASTDLHCTSQFLEDDKNDNEIDADVNDDGDDSKVR